MRTSILNVVRRSLSKLNEWLINTPERALDEAYEAAQMIRSIEETHFGGNKISLEHGSYGKSAQDYFQAELKKYLDIATVRLAEFKTSNSVLRLSNQITSGVQVETRDDQTVSITDRPALMLNKLRYIDEVLDRYSTTASSLRPRPRPPVVVTIPTRSDATGPRIGTTSRLNALPAKPQRQESAESIVDKTGVLPRSILRTVDRIKRELDPQAEEEVVETFRSSKARTVVALRFILILVIIPLLTQQISKNFLVGPIVDRVRNENPEAVVFLNSEMEEEAMAKLTQYEERFRFEMLTGRIAPLSEAEIEDQLRDRAAVIEEDYRSLSSDAIKNVFSDIFAIAAFVLVFLASKREIAILKSFIDELVYGLSDSAKAFIIILFTDTFVGFHSPHGWEVILEGISRHLGLPANREFIFLFIATFPVILDTVFKYWIFRYLNRISPSAVATYRNMNE